MGTGDFPGGPVVKTSLPNAESAGSIPDQGTRSPRAMWPKNQKMKQKQQYHKVLTKNSPHQDKENFWEKRE